MRRYDRDIRGDHGIPRCGYDVHLCDDVVAARGVYSGSPRPNMVLGSYCCNYCSD